VESWKTLVHFVKVIRDAYNDGREGMIGMVQKLNTKAQSLRDFRANFQNSFNFPLSRSKLLSYLDADGVFSGDCLLAMNSIIQTIQEELVALSPGLLAGR